MEILYLSILKSPTNSGDLAKQYFLLAKSDKDKYDTALIIKKYVLSDNFELYEKDCPEFEMVREYKGKRLYKTGFSIKYDTLQDLMINIEQNIQSHE